MLCPAHVSRSSLLCLSTGVVNVVVFSSFFCSAVRTPLITERHAVPTKRKKGAYCTMRYCSLPVYWYTAAAVVVRPMPVETQNSNQNIEFQRHPSEYFGYSLLLAPFLAPLEPQSRFGGKPLKFQVFCPQNGTAVLKGLKRKVPNFRTTPKKTIMGPMLGQDRLQKSSGGCLVRSGEIPSPRQTSIDKTNDCVMK